MPFGTPVNWKNVANETIKDEPERLVMKDEPNVDILEMRERSLYQINPRERLHNSVDLTFNET